MSGEAILNIENDEMEKQVTATGQMRCKSSVPSYHLSTPGLGTRYRKTAQDGGTLSLVLQTVEFKQRK